MKVVEKVSLGVVMMIVTEVMSAYVMIPVTPSVVIDPVTWSKPPVIKSV